LGLKEERRDRKVIGEIFKMGIRSEKENIGLSRKRGNIEGKLRSRARKRMWKYEERIIGGGSSEIKR